ncbi:Hypothetical_protein [Hexamita inflata]|uniref:Hypothetical_protein n=1 Tax=Hexamita inflata TaxID=28002 RepID=A0AA86PH78_9EUKA|nr:Hypothetical protein HINF_LOCUS23452 [Hexamita inflata]
MKYLSGLCSNSHTSSYKNLACINCFTFDLFLPYLTSLVDVLFIVILQQTTLRCQFSQSLYTNTVWYKCIQYDPLYSTVEQRHVGNVLLRCWLRCIAYYTWDDGIYSPAELQKLRQSSPQMRLNSWVTL